MKLIVKNNTIRLIDNGDTTEYTIHFNSKMISFYEGFVDKTVDRIYITLDDMGYIHDDSLLEILKLRGIEGEFGFYDRLVVNNTLTHVLDFIGETKDPIREAHLLLDNDELYEKYATTYKFQP